MCVILNVDTMEIPYCHTVKWHHVTC